MNFSQVFEAVSIPRWRDFVKEQNEQTLRIQVLAKGLHPESYSKDGIRNLNPTILGRVP